MTYAQPWAEKGVVLRNLWTYLVIGAKIVFKLAVGAGQNEKKGGYGLTFFGKLAVTAGEHDRRYCPVSAFIPASYKECPALVLVDRKTRKRYPCQVSKAKEGILLTWFVHGLKAGARQVLVAEGLPDAEPSRGVAITNVSAEGRVNVDIHGRPFTAYHYGKEWVRPFLHPVIGPYGTHVTRNWPITTGVKGEHKDHPHHKSIWVAYGECGKTDNWSEEPGHGWQRHQRFLELTSGPVFGRIVAKNHWRHPNGRKQFEEVRDMHFYALPGSMRLCDIAVTFRMTEGPVTFRDTKEGGLLSVRVASSMDVRNGGKIENGFGGINEAETWGKPAPWCDYSGMVNGRHVGIAVFDHGSNPRYPTGWHVRDYGLMTANCFAWKYYKPEAKVKGDMAFRKGQKTTWQYRLYIHKGDAGTGNVSDRYLDYFAPPGVIVA